MQILPEYITSKVYEMHRQIKVSKVGDSGKPVPTRLLEISYSTEGLMPDLNIIFETMGHVCPLIESNVCGLFGANVLLARGLGDVEGSSACA